MFNRKSETPKVAFLDDTLAPSKAVYAADSRERACYGHLSSADDAALLARFDIGVGQEVFNTAVRVAQKSKNWVRIQFESRLLNKVEECSPDVLFDLEKKFEFTGLVSSELAAFSETFLNVSAGLGNAIERKDEMASSEHAQFALQLIDTFLGRMNQHYHDFGHFFKTDVYEQYRTKLNTMKTADRRAIDAFYTQFESSVAVMRRVFEKEIPSAQNAGAVNLDLLFRWLTQVSTTVDSMYETAVKILKA